MVDKIIFLLVRCFSLYFDLSITKDAFDVESHIKRIMTLSSNAQDQNINIPVLKVASRNGFTFQNKCSSQFTFMKYLQLFFLIKSIVKKVYMLNR